jgi:hypothetical protein
MTQDEIVEIAAQTKLGSKAYFGFVIYQASGTKELEAFAKLVAEREREAIYQLVMEAPFKEFDRQEEEFDGEAATAMKAMAFSLTSAIRARAQADGGEA